MNRLIERELSVMEHEVVDTTGNHAEGRAAYDVFLYFDGCSQSLLGQGVTLDFANSHTDRPARRSGRCNHTYYGHGFNFYIKY